MEYLPSAYSFHLSRDNLVAFLISISVVLVVLRTANRRTRTVSLSPGKAMEPPMISSWLPWIGSGLDFLSHPLTFFKTYSNRHNSLFKFKFFGQKIIAISSPTAISNLLRNHSGSFDIINGQSIHLLIGLKASKDRVPHIYSAFQKAVLPLHRAMTPSRLPIVSSRLSEELLKALKQIDLTNNRFSLDDFVHRTFYTATSIALLGPDVPLHTYENFMIFDEGVGLHVRQLGVFARVASVARESVFASWRRHFIEHWVPENNGYLVGAADVMSDIYRELKRMDLSHDEVHRLMFGVLWASHVNLMELTTWVMCHIITDRDIYTRVCQEIRNFVNREFPQIDKIVQINPRVFDNDDAFRFLNSVILEVIRTKTTPGPTRVATRDAVLMDENEKEILIRKGEMIMVNVTGMHHSPSLHEEPEVFKADRFINNAGYQTYLFGGGKHICPGRNLGQFAVRQFIILTLAMYDIRVQNNAINGSGSLVEPDGAMGIKLMLFSRRRNDVLISLEPASASLTSR